MHRRHTVPKMAQDGNTMTEIFEFGDRENIGPFVSLKIFLHAVASPVQI